MSFESTRHKYMLINSEFIDILEQPVVVVRLYLRRQFSKQCIVDVILFTALLTLT